MNNKFLQSIKVIALAMILILGTSYVWAFQDTTSAPTGGNVPAPVNTGPFDQVKEGFLRTNKFFQADQYLKAGNSLSIDSIFSSLGFPPGSILTSLLNGYSFAEKVMVSPWGMFGKLRAGATANNNTGAVSVNLNGLSVDEEANDHGAGLQIDVRGGSTGRDVLSLLAKEIGQNRVSSVLNKPFFQLWDTLNNKEGIFKGRSIQITEGGPARGKILVSGDNDGTAVWATMGTTGVSSSDISVVRRLSTTRSEASRLVTAVCPSGSIAISGGGDCQNGTIAISQPFYYPEGGGNLNTYPESTNSLGQETAIPPTGWILRCDNKDNDDVHVSVICMKPGASLVSNVPTAPKFDANGLEIAPGIKSWQNSTISDGSIGQSCSDWLATNGVQIDTTSDIRTRNILGYYAVGNCVYGKYSTNPIYGYAEDCRSVPLSNSAPVGYKPVSSCVYMTGNPASPAEFGFEIYR